MLETILGNKSAVRVMRHIFIYEEVHASQISHDYQTALDPIRNQLEKFEAVGILSARTIGRMKLYRFNKLNPYYPALIELIKISIKNNNTELDTPIFRGLNEIN